MAISAAQNDTLHKVFTGMFGAAIGGYYSELSDMIASGTSPRDLAGIIATSTNFKTLYPSSSGVPTTFANQFLTNLLGSSFDATALANDAAWLAGRISTNGVGKAVFDYLVLLDGTTSTTYAAAKTAWTAKVAASQAYTGASTDLATLQAAAGSGINPANTILTTGAQTLTGTTLSDTYIATNATLDAADQINDMGGSADTLKLSSNAVMATGAFEMTGVENVIATADQGNGITLDMSGSTGVTKVESLNSTGAVTFNQLTSLANVEINNATNNANTTVQYQNSVVAGAADTVALALTGTSNTNTNIGTITIGNQADANGGVETLNVTVSGANTTVATIDTDMTTLNIAGANNLVVTAALNGTERTINAGTMTGNLTLTSTGTGANAVTFTGSQGVDTVTFANTTGNHTITAGAGADVITLGLGDDTVDLGAGADTLLVTTNGLTVNDTITGGADADTLRLTAADTISKSEAEKVTAIETFDLRTTGSTLVVTDNLLTTISTGSDRFTVNTENATGANTIDLTNATFSNINKFALTAERDLTTGTSGDQIADNETVIASDATINAKAILEFGAGATDTLRVVDGATMTSDDLANIAGLEVMELTSASNVAQTWNIQLTDSFVRGASAANNDDTDGTVAVLATAAVAAGSLVIDIDNDVPAGSIVNIDTNALTAALGANAVTVRNNANVTVNVTGTGAGQVNVINSLRYTLNADNMTGTAVADTFVADTLAQVQTADSITGATGTDILQLNFSLNNVATTVMAQLNNTAIAGVETLTFNTNNAVSFSDDGYTSINTINFGSGNDVVGAANSAATYNMGNGDNSITTAGANVETIVTGTGTDAVAFAAVGQWVAIDTLILGAGTDTATVTATNQLDTSTFTRVSGLDKIVYIASGGAPSLLTIGDSMVNQADNTNNLVVDINDTGTNASTIFTAAGVTAGNAVTVNLIANTTIAGAGTPDVIGGAGNDTFVVTADASADGTTIRGNAGADTITLAADTTTNMEATYIELATENDGGAQGANTGYDTITGFQTTKDRIQFADGEGLELGIDDMGSNGTIVWKTDVAADFTANDEALLLTQSSNGITDAQLVELGFATVIGKISVTATGGDEGLVVVQGETDTAVYLYTENGSSPNNVSASELKLLALVDGAILVAGDFAIA